LQSAIPPSATGPAGALFEGRVGAFYFLSLLAGGEPRGLPGASITCVRFQQAANGRPLDDVTIEAVNADGSEAFFDIQAKRTLDFTLGDREFADVVRRLWATAQKPSFTSKRYETAVAVARSSTRIEREYQQVLHWARQLRDGASFAKQIGRRGFSSEGMRAFVDVFRYHLTTAGAPSDDDTLWQLLKRFQILVFDFEAPGSGYEHFARERARGILAGDQAARSPDLWSVLQAKALECDAVGGSTDRLALVRDLEQTHGFCFSDCPDLRMTKARLAENTQHALADIKDHIGGARLSRAEVVEQCHQALERALLLEIVGAAGVGKSAVLKSFASRLQCEGTVLVLAPGRIVGGGWINMAHAVDCPGTVGIGELLSEFGCGGGATLFVDNIDQIDDSEAWITLRDVLRSVVGTPGWRVVLTVRAEHQEWRSKLPEELKQVSHQSIRVGEISDDEADVLSSGNPALSALLASVHPARAIARNLFHLSQLINLSLPHEPARSTPVTETDLAQAWWRFGGGRSESGKFARLKLLRALGGQLLANPGCAAFDTDELEEKPIDDLLRAESLREVRAGSTITFWHDTLRDWTLGLLLSEKPGLLSRLAIDQPMPGTLARGLEIAARLALQEDASAARWLEMAAHFEKADSHGSWRRPVLLALARAENASEFLAHAEGALFENRGQRLKELIRLMIAIEAQPLGEVLKRVQPEAVANPAAESLVIPIGQCWVHLVLWVFMAIDRLPDAAIPEAAKLFQLWLIATHNQGMPFNRAIVAKLYDWLTVIEDAASLRIRRDAGETRRFETDFGNVRQVRDDIRMTFLAFAHLDPGSAEKYLRGLERDYEARSILRFCGSAAKAAPAALADFALDLFIPQESDDNRFGGRHDHREPFQLIDMDFIPASPGQGPFFELLDSCPSEGLRLVRGVVEYATNWYREDCLAHGHACPSVTIDFVEGSKSFEGDFGIYQWARGGTGPLVVASALMALEAWAHRQIEQDRPFQDVLHDVLGASDSSIAFLCVGVDLVLSHWHKARDTAWPILATPEVLFFDEMRHSQDASGMGRFFLQERESSKWPVKLADLLERPSRGCRLIDQIGSITFHGPDEMLSRTRVGLEAACQRIAVSFPGNDDPLNGLHATAANALRMTDAANWTPIKGRLRDGSEAVGYQYQLAPDAEAARGVAQARSAADLAVTSLKLRIQKALTEPATSSPEIVAEAIAWAQSKIATGLDAASPNEEPDEFQRVWTYRAFVMAAAVAVRDYSGPDRAAIETWARPILETAVNEEITDVVSRGSPHVYSSPPAIAALGFAALFLKYQDPAARDMLLMLAARQDHAVLNAIGSQIAELNRLHPRLARSLSRVILASAVHPRRTMEPDEDASNREVYGQRRAASIRQETSWLDRSTEEPPWPDLVPWYSRPRRYLRLGWSEDSKTKETEREPPEEFIDEQILGIWTGHLVGLTVGEVADWLIPFAQHLMTWTIEANNGPAGDQEGERDNRPNHWNRGFFNLLGFLCVGLPFRQARTLVLEPMTRLHDQAFHDVVSYFLQSFDWGTLAIDTKEPENPRGVRALLVERLRQGRAAQHLNDEVSFTAESHFSEALNAMFYQPSRWANANGPYIPERWNGLLECMPVLSPLIVATPKSGYLAVTFLTLVESFPCPAFYKDVVEVLAAWCATHDVGSGFWSEHNIGNRVCLWFERALVDDPEARSLAEPLRERLRRSLDALVRSGITSARVLESKIAIEQAHRDVRDVS
jgi:hypothetical protein